MNIDINCCPGNRVTVTLRNPPPALAETLRQSNTGDWLSFDLDWPPMRFSCRVQVISFDGEVFELLSDLTAGSLLLDDQPVTMAIGRATVSRH